MKILEKWKTNNIFFNYVIYVETDISPITDLIKRLHSLS